MQKLPEHGMCFVCGSDNPHSMGITWTVQDDGSITTEATLNESQQGPPHMAHGGASAAMLDEAMGAAVWVSGVQAAAINLNVEYHKPVPLGQRLSLRAWITGVEDNIVRTAGEISLTDGEVAVAAQGVYKRARHLFTDVKFEAKE